MPPIPRTSGATESILVKGAAKRAAQRKGGTVRTIELSNHPGDALRLARQRLADASQQDQAEFEEALARHELLVRRARNARDRARSQRQWLAWLRGAANVRKMRRLAPVPPAGGAVAPSDAEEILRAGITGEQQVATEFGKVLSDDWVLVRGYCNRLGEIDYLLLGPPGLIAIESKHLGATVSCDGDDWRYSKLDRSGNLVEQGPIADRRGRSPSVQLGEPATMLEEFLSSQGGPAARATRSPCCAWSCSPTPSPGSASAGIPAFTSSPRRLPWPFSWATCLRCSPPFTAPGSRN